MIEKGICGNLKKVDDLFDLPESLNIASLADRFHQSVDNTKKLFHALHKSFSREFYSIGLLRLMADMSGFAGPILLGGLLTTSSDSTENNAENGDYKPYLYALGLFASTLLGKVTKPQSQARNHNEFNFQLPFLELISIGVCRS